MVISKLKLSQEQVIRLAAQLTSLIITITVKVYFWLDVHRYTTRAIIIQLIVKKKHDHPFDGHAPF